MKTFVEIFYGDNREELENTINNYAQSKNLEIINASYVVDNSGATVFTREAMVVFRKGE